jgi:hypothetical protein
MIAEAPATRVCTKRLSLLELWLSVSGEYARLVHAAINPMSEVERISLRTAIEDAKAQMQAARRLFELHRITHGC